MASYSRKYRSTWRDVRKDARERVAETMLPPVSKDFIFPRARKAPWLVGSVDDAMALPSRGWVVGHFDGCAERSTDCQIKLWSFHGTLGDAYPWKRLTVTEFDVVFDGVLNVAMRKNDRAVVEYLSVRAGQWIIMRSGLLYRALAGDHASGVTVRWPANHGGKVVVS